jgi:hypothetical protein
MLLFTIFCSTACLHVASRLECLIVSHLLILCSLYYLCQQFLCSASHFFVTLANHFVKTSCCFALWFIFWHFNVFVIGILFCVNNFIMCQPFYFMLAILFYLSHFHVVCQPFYVISVISMLCQPFYFMSAISCCASHSIFVCHFIYFVSAILGSVSHLI